MPSGPVNGQDITQIKETRDRLMQLAELGASDYPDAKQFPAGQFDQACESAAEALWRVMVLSHVHFDTPLPH